MHTRHKTLQLSTPASQQMYQGAGAQQGAGQQAGGQQEQPKQDDNIQDADFEEVK